MKDQTDSWVETALDDLAAADARVVVPDRLKAAVLREWDARQTAGRRHGMQAIRFRKAAAWILPAAAVVVMAIALFERDPATAPVPTAHPGSTGASAVLTPATARPAAIDSGYVIVPDPFADTAALHVVRVRMARMALATLGMPITDPDAEGLVDVEMLVGDDGVARSIRNATFVRENTERGAGR